ncbi:conserved hypothetical protein [Desulfonatronospira thiodismutans ASO3-1]|uniref:Uncharacterized protein n=1 Tax=Desulfonatronospira thiodismutans ASO3-1 TaxID=555779 RepID=D6SJS5_9BACT|nr:hypothetical protein [Desulfonatronospira thiodismutans]EFI36128.1 conserved hypothetical protein [Desulfonatronospira thiodismutans ASO3-1]
MEWLRALYASRNDSEKTKEALILRWLPWKYFVRRAARSYGIIDPIRLMARMRRFSQPSEVNEPIELLRAGIIFHARGLINTRAIQHNLDWVWPFWVQKQFNPDDSSFIPRAFSITHVNLTHRNWTAVGHPDLPLYPIVDPRGLVTPHIDGWSLDFWIVDKDGEHLLPSRAQQADQELRLESDLEVATQVRRQGRDLRSTTRVEVEENAPRARIRINAESSDNAWLAVSIRPYNPEGVQFVEKLEFREKSCSWLINGDYTVFLERQPEKILHANYLEGDVLHGIQENDMQESYKVKCPTGMATGAALYRLQPGVEQELDISVPLGGEKAGTTGRISSSREAWKRSVQGTAALNVPDKKMQFIYDAAVRSILLLSADDVVPGPYTYKRFWFRDACLMLNAMLALGLDERIEVQMDRFPGRQKYSGYFHSQEGEWDSNGQVLWIMGRYQDFTGGRISRDWWKAMEKAVKWIDRKRMTSAKNQLHAGLLPAGFSAEHLGPNDYYYWDNFWSLAGLRVAARIAQKGGDERLAGYISRIADSYHRDIQKSIASIPERRKQGAIPASPNRRMDAGAIGSLVADYPLQLYPVGSTEILNTARFLMQNCFHRGGFFQDMIHSGINAYLTLDIAQTLLRHKEPGFRDLVEAVADMASPTGQWPEAIHPITAGGCMGDGQHGWAAAEWIMMMRNMFVREEEGGLVLFSGVFPEWITSGQEVSFGPAPTAYGTVDLALYREEGQYFASVQGTWKDGLPDITIAVPGFEEVRTTDLDRPVQLLPV